MRSGLRRRSVNLAQSSPRAAPAWSWRPTRTCSATPAATRSPTRATTPGRSRAGSATGRSPARKASRTVLPNSRIPLALAALRNSVLAGFRFGGRNWIPQWPDLRRRNESPSAALHCGIGEWRRMNKHQSRSERYRGLSADCMELARSADESAKAAFTSMADGWLKLADLTELWAAKYVM
jgi:hypothetical protein